MRMETKRLKNVTNNIIVIDIEPVPGNLLKLVQYKCKPSMKNPCGSNIYPLDVNIRRLKMWQLQRRELQ